MKSLEEQAKDFYKSALKNMKWLSIEGSKGFNILSTINRAIKPKQVTKMCKSLELFMMILRPILVAELSFITGKKQLYIIDGQHLFNALIRLGWDIPYTVIQIKDKKDLVEKIAMLNASSATWTMSDYVTAWGSLKSDYVKLNRYFEIYDLEILQIAAIMMDNVAGGGNVTRILKSGEFKIVNEQENVEVLNYVTDMLKVVPRMSRFENRYAVTEYVKFLRSTPKYNHKKFLEGLERNKSRFLLATQEEGKLSQLFKRICLN